MRPLLTVVCFRDFSSESEDVNMKCGRRVIDQIYRVVPGLVLLLSWAATAQRATAQLPNPDLGPGGPILVITSSSSIYGKYYPEVLRTEGFNEFAVKDIGAVTQGLLDSSDVALLAGPMSLTPAQVTMFTNWVNSGGNLITMQPDPQLASLLGLTSTGVTLPNAYMRVDTSTAPGNGIFGNPMQIPRHRE